MKKNTTTKNTTKKEERIAGVIVSKKFKGQPVEMFQLKDAEKHLLIEAVMTLTKTQLVKVYSHNEIKAFGDATMSNRKNEYRPFQYHVSLEKFNTVFKY